MKQIVRDGVTTMLSNHVGPHNKRMALLVRGLPFSVTKDQIIEFFKDFGSFDDHDVFIEQFNDRKTGKAIVIF